MSGGSLWSAAAWSRFGSPLLDSPLPRRLNYSLVRSGCKEARRPVLVKDLGQRIDYQSGSKQPHSKGCRIIIIMVVAFIIQRPLGPTSPISPIHDHYPMLCFGGSLT